MGGGSSKESQLERYGKQLGRVEREAVGRCFLAISGSESAQSFGEGQLRAYLSRPSFSLPAEISSRLFQALASNLETGGTAGEVSFAQFVSKSSTLLRGSLSQQSPLLHQLFSSSSTSSSSSSVSIESIEATLLALLTSLHNSETVLCVYPHVRSWVHSDDSCRLLVTHLLTSLQEKQRQSSPGGPASSSSDKSVSVAAFEAWLRSTQLAARIVELALGVCFFNEVVSGRGIPPEVLSFFGVDPPDPDELSVVSHERLLHPVKTQHPHYRESFESSLLDAESLILLNQFFPSGTKGDLFPLFSSRHHGESFSTFCKGLIGCGGPTLIVIRDTEGCVFGGFAAVKWMLHPQFTGNANCFLFSLRPKLAVFTPTGYNENFMYLQQNAMTLPNGLGMGGQVDYFGLWLSGDYGAGHSKAQPKCTTFGSPMLSGQEAFTVDMLELWGVGRPVVPDEQDGAARPSILDKDKVANTILEMAGKTRHSEGLREPEEDS